MCIRDSGETAQNLRIEQIDHADDSRADEIQVKQSLIRLVIMDESF